MININGSEDNSYRYKMPVLQCAIKGNGNGIYTIITNLNDVSKYINHPPNLLLKFMSTYNGSMANEEKMSITGSYTSDELHKTLQIYINRFVICPKCNIPETIPQINKQSKKNIILELKCSSCGSISSVLCNNKNEIKAYDLIVKYLEKNLWTTTKGTMVSFCDKNNISSNEINEEDDINPFG